jgi:predicted nucleic acid-binding protein
MKIPDSSCIISVFNELGELCILFDWIDEGYAIVVPNAVYAELCGKKQTKEKLKQYIDSKKIILSDLVSECEIGDFKRRYSWLGAGEVSVILTGIKLNQEKKRYYAVLDDRRARMVAEKHDVNYTGTYGLLRALKEKKRISIEDYNTIKEKMRSVCKFDVDKLENDYRSKH